MMPLDDFIYMIINFVLAFIYLSLIIMLHTSKERSHHTTFFSIFKVTGLYGVVNLISSSDYHTCVTSRDVYILKREINSISSFSFCSGCLLMEIQRFLVLRSPSFGENVISSRKLYLVFVVQFFISTVAMSPNLFASVVWKDGCIDHMERKKQRVIILVVASAYCSYFIFSALLTSLTIQRMRASSENIRKRISARQLSLVYYTIVCSVTQFLKGVILFVRVATYFWDTDAFLLELADVLFYPVNIFTVTSSYFLLIIFSHSVRRRIRKVLCCLKSPPTITIASSIDNNSRRYSLSQH